MNKESEGDGERYRSRYTGIERYTQIETQRARDNESQATARERNRQTDSERYR